MPILGYIFQKNITKLAMGVLSVYFFVHKFVKETQFEYTLATFKCKQTKNIKIGVF